MSFFLLKQLETKIHSSYISVNRFCIKIFFSCFIHLWNIYHASGRAFWSRSWCICIKWLTWNEFYEQYFSWSKHFVCDKWNHLYLSTLISFLWLKTDTSWHSLMYTLYKIQIEINLANMLLSIHVTLMVDCALRWYLLKISFGNISKYVLI